MAASPRVPRTSGDDQPGGGQDVVGSNRGNATFGSKRTAPVVCQGMNGSHRGTTTAAVHSVVGAAGTGRGLDRPAAPTRVSTEARWHRAPIAVHPLHRRGPRVLHERPGWSGRWR